MSTLIQSRPVPFVAAPAASAGAPAVDLQSPSAWIWVPYVWLFIVSTRGLSIWLDMAGVGDTVADPDLAGSPIDRALMTVLITLGLVALARRTKRTMEILGANKWLVVLFIYMALSITWSNFPDITFRRCLRSVGTLVMVLVALTEQDPLGAIRSLLRRLYLVHIPLSIITIKYFRSIGVAYSWNGVQEMWVGLTRHKNNLGQVAMFSGLLSTWQIFQNWSRKKLTVDVLLLVMTLWVLRGSGTNHSATAILGFIVCTAVLFALQFIKGRARQAKRILLWGTVAFLLSVPVMLMVVEAFDMTPAEAILEATGRDMTLSDRTYLWKDLLDNAAKTRTFGVGFGAFWVGPLGYELYPFPNWAKVTRTWRPREGHNGYIDVYVDLGLVGLVLMLLVILFAVLSTLDDLESRFEFGRLRVILLLSILINNFAESSFLNGTHALWFMFLLAGVRVPNAAQRAKSFTVARLRRVVAPQVLRVPAGGMAHSLYRGGVMTPKTQLRRP